MAISNQIRELMLENFEKSKEYPAAIHCAYEMGRCPERPVGYNYNDGSQFTLWACLWHIEAEDKGGVWLASKEILVS